MADPNLHAFQHAGFLASALLFWQAVLPGRPSAARYGTSVVCLFLTALHTGLLGALLIAILGSAIVLVVLRAMRGGDRQA